MRRPRLSEFPLLYPGTGASEKNGFMEANSSLAEKIVFESFPEPLRSKEVEGSFPVLGRIPGKKEVGWKEVVVLLDAKVDRLKCHELDSHHFLLYVRIT